MSCFSMYTYHVPWTRDLLLLTGVFLAKLHVTEHFVASGQKKADRDTTDKPDLH
jgi:hypothetical protein